MDLHHHLPISENIAVVSGMERSGIISLHAHLSMRDMCLHIRKCISRPSVLLEAAFSGKSLWEVSEDEGRITLSEKNESKLLLWTSGKDFQNQDGMYCHPSSLLTYTSSIF